MKRIYGVDSVFGNGQTFYDENGQMVGYSVDSVLGAGQTFYNADGQHVGYSIDSVIGNGQNLYSDEDGLVGYTVDSRVILIAELLFYLRSKGALRQLLLYVLLHRILLSQPNHLSVFSNSAPYACSLHVTDLFHCLP